MSRGPILDVVWASVDRLFRESPEWKKAVENIFQESDTTFIFIITPQQQESFTTHFLVPFYKYLIHHSNPLKNPRYRNHGPRYKLYVFRGTGPSIDPDSFSEAKEKLT